MKRIFLVLIMSGLMGISYAANSFDLSLGLRYSAAPIVSEAGLNNGYLQGEVLIGPLQLAAGYLDLGSGNTIIPVTAGYLWKFPVPVIAPYIGTDFTYYFSNIKANPILSLTPVGTLEAKVGGEARIGQLGIYGGIGYGLFAGYFSLLAVPLPFLKGSLIWEAGARFYFL